MGIKLNSPNKRLKNVIRLKTINTEGERLRNLIESPKIKTKRKLAPGPAIATFNSPHLWSRKLYGFTGTGFAQPITKGLLMITKSKGKTIVPKGSICFEGFKLSLPAYFAVGSPN